MPGPTGYSALLATLRDTARLDPQAFLTALQVGYGLTHVLYGDLRRDGGTYLPGTLIHGRDPDLERVIRESGLVVLHPLFEAAARRFGPDIIDPRELLEAGPSPTRMQPGRGECGPLIVFPLVPSRPGVAFLACAPGLPGGWHRNDEALMRDLAALAGLFHARQLTAPVPGPRARTDHGPPRLTPREREVLQWVALGKTYWEIARILGISERTVRHFMAACREKLGAVSNKQAVARAVAARIVEAG